VGDGLRGSGGEVLRRLARPALGWRLRIQPQVGEDLLDDWPLDDGRATIFSSPPPQFGQSCMSMSKTLEQARPADAVRPGWGLLSLALVGTGGFGGLLCHLGPLRHHPRPQPGIGRQHPVKADLALGPRAGQMVLSLRTVARREDKHRKALCADAHGFSLHAAVRLASHQCKELKSMQLHHPPRTRQRTPEPQCQGAGGAEAQEPDSRQHRPHRDAPQEIMQSLAALVPRPRLHLIRFHGMLTPNAKLRGAVIPQPARKDSAPAQEHTHGQATWMRWARLLKRVFHMDVERCACGGQLKILAAIEEPVLIVGNLTHLGLAARAPPREAARELSLGYSA